LFRISNPSFSKFLKNVFFSESASYWEKRYRKNGNSGAGSYGALACYKATILNSFIQENQIKKAVEFGCGDGNQLKQYEIAEYLGLDVSVTAIEKCRRLFKSDSTKSFLLYNSQNQQCKIDEFKAELSLSFDVIYHLIEESVYENYMRHLFSSPFRFVIIYAWDVEGKRNLHVRHRKFSRWIKENQLEWDLVKQITEGKPAGACDFYIYQKK
jgi:hypothetical protein